MTKRDVLVIRETQLNQHHDSLLGDDARRRVESVCPTCGLGVRNDFANGWWAHRLDPELTDPRMVERWLQRPASVAS